MSEDQPEKKKRWGPSNTTIIAIATLVTAIATLIGALNGSGPA
ncbi:hypothetical protein [Actinoplanes sp. NPDC049802]